jgi:hypothetical protein
MLAAAPVFIWKGEERGRESYVGENALIIGVYVK